MQARELMKTHVVKTTPTASIAEAVDLMDIYQINSLPVVDSQGRLCGLIAEQDICRAVYGAWASPNHAALSDTAVRLPAISPTVASTPVEWVMQRAVVSVAEDADVATTMRAFFVNDYTRIPVIRADGGVIGTLNRVDILQAIFERMLPGPGE